MTSPPFVSRLSRQCGFLNVSHPYIGLLLLLLSQASSSSSSSSGSGSSSTSSTGNNSSTVVAGVVVVLVVVVVVVVVVVHMLLGLQSGTTPSTHGVDPEMREWRYSSRHSKH
jgi:hypothetical protein